MDQKISEVLAIYHARIEEENTVRARLPHAPERVGGPDTWMRAVGPQTGQLINILARSLAAPQILEIGTSYGYSGIWLAEAARAAGGRLITMELLDYKSAHAQEMTARAGLSEFVDFRVGDAVRMIEEHEGKFDFILLDLWKDLYVPCLEAFYPKLNPGALIVADNMLRPASDEVRIYRKVVRSKPDIVSMMLPVGMGLELSCYQGQ